MKYSITINPISQNSQASKHAYMFVKAILQKKTARINVFFYGYAVKSVFFNNIWDDMCDDVNLIACSTIADQFIEEGLTAQSNITIAGLGQWMDALVTADKRIEFA